MLSVAPLSGNAFAFPFTLFVVHPRKAKPRAGTRLDVSGSGTTSSTHSRVQWRGASPFSGFRRGAVFAVDIFPKRDKMPVLPVSKR